MTSTVVMTTEPTTCASLDFCNQVGSASALSIPFFLRAVIFSTVVRGIACEKRYFFQALYRTVWQGVGESDRRLAGPVDVNRFSVSPRWSNQ